MTDKQHDPLVCPKRGSSADEIDAFLKRIIDPESSRRVEYEDELLIAKAKVEGKQWLNKVKQSGSTRDYRRVTRIKESARTDIPTPTDNLMLEAVENEVARLCKRNSEVFVEPSDASPGAKAGAKIGTDVLMDHLDEIRWPRIRYRSTWRNVQYGTMVLKSFLQQDNLDTVKVPVPGVLKCGGLPQPPMFSANPLDPPIEQPNTECDFKLTSAELGPEHIGKLPPGAMASLGMDDSMTLEGVPEDVQAKPKYTADSCLTCGGEMEPYTPAGEELGGTDAVGRPLGKDTPLGRAMIESPSLFSVFYENEGIGVQPDTLREIAECTPRSLDWIKQYYTKNIDQVVVEDPSDIAETCPIWGEYGANSKGATGAAARIYRNHCRVREYYKWPTVDYPKGRAIVMAGRVVLMDDDLMIESLPVEGQTIPEKPFPRVLYTVARCFPKDDEMQGQGFPVHADSDQNRINMTLSQIVDTRERHGVDGILATRGMKLVAPAWASGTTGRIMHWDVDPLAPNQEPKPFQTKMMDPAVWKELEYSHTRVGQRLGTNDIETGNAPPGLKAYSAIRYLGEKASERREQREKEIINAYEELFRHQLLLMQRFYREPRAYAVKLGEEREKREFTGMQLQGETRAKVRERPSFDMKTAEREALAENIQLFPEITQSPYGRREAAKILGVPDVVMGKANVQLEDAEAKWMDFIRTKAIPVVDENLDDHNLMFDQYGRLLKTNEGKDIAKRVGWDEVLKRTNGWRNILFPAPISIPAPPSLDPKAPPQPPMMIPQPGPAPTGIPLQDQILFVWGLMMSQGAPPPPPPQMVEPGMLPPPPPPAQTYPPMQPSPELQSYMAFRAAYEAHHLLGEGQLGGQMPAPGSGAMGPMPGGAPSVPGAGPAPLPPLNPVTEAA